MAHTYATSTSIFTEPLLGLSYAYALKKLLRDWLLCRLWSSTYYSKVSRNVMWRTVRIKVQYFRALPFPSWSVLDFLFKSYNKTSIPKTKRRKSKTSCQMWLEANDGQVSFLCQCTDLDSISTTLLFISVSADCSTYYLNSRKKVAFNVTWHFLSLSLFGA